MTDDVTIDQAGASTLAGRAEELLDGSSIETLPAGGDAIGRYVVLEHLGTGGMGVVFAAYDPKLDRKVAVKLLRSGDASNSSSESAGARLLDEARALARLSHPNVITVHDVGVHDGRIFVAMEFVDGQTLATWQRAAPRDRGDLLRVYAAAGEGLAAAHRAGLVHRDFKPDNVMVDGEGRIRVLDFGLARAARGNLADSELGDLPVDDPRTRGLVGTPAYMAPEQLAGEATDARTDQFSFCVALWEALFGQRPFHGDTVTALAWSTLHDEPVLPQDTAPSPRVGEAILRGLSKDPARRFASMELLLRELRADRSSKRSWARLGGAAIVGGAIAVAAVNAWPDRDDRCTARADVADVWGPDARRALADALGRQAAKSPGAHRLEAKLDSYGKELSSRLRRACEAESRSGTVPDDHARTVRCLQRRRSALEQTVAFLLSGSERVAVRGDDIVNALPQVVDCDDPGADEPEADTDPERIALVDALESRLDEAHMRTIGGQRAEPRAILDEALSQASANGFHGIEARARYIEGSLEGASGREKDARVAYEKGFVLALRAGRTELAMSASAALVEHHAHVAADLPGARLWLEIARALAGRSTPSAARRVALANATGTLAFAEADYPAALDAYTEAVEVCLAAVDDRARCVRNINDAASTLMKLGRHEEALGRMDEALAAHVEARGEAHPQTAVLRTSYATALASLGRTEEALEHAKAALATAEAHWGADSTEVISFLGNTSDILIGLGRLDEAAGLLDRIVSTLESGEPLDRLMMSYAHHSRGMLSQARGSFGAAAQDFARSAELREELYGADHPLVRDPRMRRADALLTAGEPRLALDELDRIVTTCPDEGCTASDLVARAVRVEALAATNRVAEAEAALAELVTARDRASIEDETTRARLRAAELCLARPTQEVIAERQRLHATLREHDDPGSPAAARLESRSEALRRTRTGPE